MTAGTRKRFEIRYSTQRWSDGKWFYGSFLVILAGLTAFKILQHQSMLDFIPALVLDAAVLLALYLMRLVSYVDVGPDSLQVRYIFRRMTLPYTGLSKIRRQALDVAFAPAERRRFVNRFVRRLGREPAAYVRLDRRQADLLAESERRLGPRFVAGPDIVLPLVDVDAFIAEMKGKLRGN